MAIDLSAATTKRILFKKGNGEILTKTATFETDGTDGKVYYRSVSGDLTPSGTWQIEADLITPSYEGRSSTGIFKVEGSLVRIS